MPGSDQTDHEIDPKIDFESLTNYLASPPRYFSSRRFGEWQVLNKAGVLCTVVVPRRKLFRAEVVRCLRNAEISPEEEIARLVESWYLAGLLSK
jgi:hypothetical protein